MKLMYTYICIYIYVYTHLLAASAISNNAAKEKDKEWQEHDFQEGRQGADEVMYEKDKEIGEDLRK